MKLSRCLLILIFSISWISGFRISKNYPQFGFVKSSRNRGLDLVQDELLPPDAGHLLLEDALALLLARNTLPDMQNREQKEMRGLSITNNLEVLKDRLINEIARKRSRQVCGKILEQFLVFDF